MGPKMEERGPSSGNQMKTEKGELSNGPPKTDETMKTDKSKNTQNGQLKTAREVVAKGNKKEEQVVDSGEESLLRRIIRRLSMKKKKKGKKSSEVEIEDDSKAELEVVEEVKIEVTLSEPTSST